MLSLARRSGTRVFATLGLALAIVLTAIERGRVFGVVTDFPPVPWLDILVMNEKNAVGNRFQLIVGVIGGSIFVLLCWAIWANPRREVRIAALPVMALLLVSAYRFWSTYRIWATVGYGIDRGNTVTLLILETTSIVAATLLWFALTRWKSTRLAVVTCWIAMWALTNLAGTGILGNSL